MAAAESEGSERLINLKLPKAERDKMTRPTSIEDREYSYGLSIRLENNELAKLGIKVLPKVGQKIMIEAQAKVTSVSESTSEGNRGDRAVTLQLTDMLIEKE